MKKITLIIVVFLLFTFNFSLSTLLAQAPQAFKYQAVVRDAGGLVLANQVVNFRISILKSNASGTAVYVETQKDTTNPFGLANLKIGNGTLVSGSFTTINWGNDLYFVKIEFDANGGSSFQLMGTSQLLSVPYALYSEKAGGDWIWTKNGNNIYATDTIASAGIGTSYPDASGILTLRAHSNSYPLIIERFDNNVQYGKTWGLFIGVTGLNFYNISDNLRAMTITPSGNIGIGTYSPSYPLSVNGTIQAKEVIVNTGWSDFVFEKDYKLMSLAELENFLIKNKHLPDVPTAKDVEDNGVALGDFNSKLLQKVEELTLYVIEQNNKIELLNDKIEKLEKNAK